MITLHRLDTTLNMRRYYCLSIEPTLFGEFALLREWGRIGARRGQEKVDTFETMTEAEAALTRIASAKQRHGYVAF